MNFRKLVLVTGMIPAVLGASVFAACGGDDDDDGGSGGTGTDEKYVASICKAGAEFATAMEKLSKIPPARRTSKKQPRRLPNRSRISPRRSPRPTRRRT
ncbi:MAG: hypothetical protein IPF51_17650 [Dehalococcoidia bacterium]|uniref:hypothetical protein n=1 Tax=Candidatus Amarobacter glycogenicus TaxID=3140699 RepID=UPI00313753D0|nr:hypothetical protein [Dehalococcoidia bacterium]